jgi:hypothetical protein
MIRFLLSVRLSWFFFIFIGFYYGLAYIIDGTSLSRDSLALFSVNSFLYGFYISPVLTGQKNRIEELSKIIRAEANALFDVLIKTKRLPRKSRNHVQSMVDSYIHASFKERKPAEGEDEYEKLIAYCLDYEGDNKETVDKILANLVDNQKNRSQLAMQLSNRVYSNEWWIVMVLFSITIGFILFLHVDNSWFLAVKALLCTGLSMLMVSLLKLSTLTHKKAKHIWDPLDRLSTSRFRRID